MDKALQLAEAMEAEMVQEMARELTFLAKETNPEDMEEGVDVRIQFLPEEDGDTAEFHLHTGDISYDTDHRGFWGTANIPFPGDERDAVLTARDLVDDLLDTLRF